MSVRVLLTDGRDLRVIEARETPAGTVFITAMGERIPAAKLLKIKGA